MAVHKSKMALVIGIMTLMVFISTRTIHLVESSRQKKLVVYNIAKKQAADIILGNKHIFIGDSSVNTKFNINSFTSLYQQTSAECT